MVRNIQASRAVRQKRKKPICNLKEKSVWETSLLLLFVFLSCLVMKDFKYEGTLYTGMNWSRGLRGHNGLKMH